MRQEKKKYFPCFCTFTRLKSDTIHHSILCFINPKTISTVDNLTKKFTNISRQTFSCLLPLFYCPWFNNVTIVTLLNQGEDVVLMSFQWAPLETLGTGNTED